MLNLQIVKLSCALFCAVLFLSGCATTANYQTIINNWQGAKIQDLINTWGKPDGAVRQANGHIVYLYTRQHITTVPSPRALQTPYTYVGNTPIMGHGFTDFSGNTVTLYCHTLFETNAQGIILNSRCQGNNCVASGCRGLIP